MAYIGKAPTPVPLTSLDIADGSVATADLADGAVTAAKIDALTATIAELNYVDGVTSAVQTQLDAKMTPSYTGDVDVTGELIADSYNETYAAVSVSSNTVTIDCEAGNVFSVTLDANVTTTTFSNPPASGTAYALALRLVQDATGSRSFAFPSTVDWPSATAPTISTDANSVDWYVFTTVDGGTTWYGFTAGQALG